MTPPEWNCDVSADVNGFELSPCATMMIDKFYDDYLKMLICLKDFAFALSRIYV
jgi:hypothetical protein